MSEQNTSNDNNETSKDEERRQFTRIPFDGLVYFSYLSKNWHAKLVDLSLKGALIELPQHWQIPASSGADTNPKNTKFNVVIGDDSFEINVGGTIVYQTEKYIGIRFEQFDLDSASHLKRLVELNLGSSLILNRELSHLFDSPV